MKTPTPPTVCGGAKKVILNVPFREKDAAKRLGAKWDPAAKTWYCMSSQKKRFNRWRRERSKYVYLRDEWDAVALSEEETFTKITTHERMIASHQYAQRDPLLSTLSNTSWTGTFDTFPAETFDALDESTKQRVCRVKDGSKVRLMTPREALEYSYSKVPRARRERWTVARCSNKGIFTMWALKPRFAKHSMWWSPEREYPWDWVSPFSGHLGSDDPSLTPDSREYMDLRNHGQYPRDDYQHDFGPGFQHKPGSSFNHARFLPWLTRLVQKQEEERNNNKWSRGTTYSSEAYYSPSGAY